MTAQSDDTVTSSPTPVRLHRIYQRVGDEDTAVRIQIVAGNRTGDFRLDISMTPELVRFLLAHAAPIPLDTAPE